MALASAACEPQISTARSSGGIGQSSKDRPIINYWLLESIADRELTAGYLAGMKYPDFAARFKAAVEHGVATKDVVDTQDALAKLFEVSGVMVWSYRNGEKMPRMGTAVRIANALGVNVNWLLAGDGDMERNRLIDLVEKDRLTANGASVVNLERMARDDQEAELLIRFRMLDPDGGGRDRALGFLKDEIRSELRESAGLDPGAKTVDGGRDATPRKKST